MTRTAARIAAVALSMGGLWIGPAAAQTLSTQTLNAQGSNVQRTTPPGRTVGERRTLAPQGGAAATLPNTFDNPAATSAPRTPVPAPAPSGQVTDAQIAEAALRSVIDQFRAGDIDEALFTPGVAAQLNSRLSEYQQLMQAFGEVEMIEARGVTDGVGLFVVTFENAATQWQVGLEEGGLVAALRFREAPPESSEPTSPAG